MMFHLINGILDTIWDLIDVLSDWCRKIDDKYLKLTVRAHSLKGNINYRHHLFLTPHKYYIVYYWFNVAF